MKTISKLVGTLLLAGLVVPTVRGQDDFFKGPGEGKQSGIDQRVPQKIVKLDPPQAKPGQTVTWSLTLKIAPGYHGYPTKQKDPSGASYVTTFDLDDKKSPAVVAALDAIKDVSSKAKTVTTSLKEVVEEFDEEVTYQLPIIVRPDAKPGQAKVVVSITTQICDDEAPGKPASCLPLRTDFESVLTILDGPPVEVDPKYRSLLQTTSPAPLERPQNGAPAPAPAAAPLLIGPDTDLEKDYEEIVSQLQKVEVKETDADLTGFLLAGVFWGFVSLLTPCVFPMIPITVSFFLKQADNEHHRPVMMALVYSGTIVVTLTFAAVLLLSFFRWLSVNPFMNFGLGALFVYFALSLFGMYEIELPSALTRFTSSREGQGGVVGTVFMALTFTIVSFACVAPFLGGFGGTAASSNLTFVHRILGGLAFSATFASPFFVLALFPTLLKKMPKSGSWLNTVKVVMGFLELAAALKFFRAGELVLIPEPTFFTYDFVLGLWVALSLLAGLYLLNLYRLPHDTPAENVGVPRLLFSFLFLGLAVYLIPAMFKFNADGENQRPGGVVYSWVDSFLLPEPRAGGGEDNWNGNLKQTLELARKDTKPGQRKLIFVDFTGETCTNCKFNEKTVFSKREVHDLMRKYLLVQLYTDKVPDKFYAPALRQMFGASTKRQRADGLHSLNFQRKAFDTEQLPLYVILEALPNGKINVVGVYSEGKINDPAAFAEFLQRPFGGNGPALAAR